MLYAFHLRLSSVAMNTDAPRAVVKHTTFQKTEKASDTDVASGGATNLYKEGLNKWATQTLFLQNHFAKALPIIFFT